MKISNFLTNLGEISLRIKSDDEVKIITSELGYNILSSSFKIEIIKFYDVKNWLNKIEVEKTIGWIFKIHKLNDHKRALSFDCILSPNNSKVTSESDTGEHLDSVWINDEKYVVSIGTEDGEIMKIRAKNNDWMPYRFKDNLGIIKSESFFSKSYKEKSITKILPFGLETKIRQLFEGEKLYFHYLIATDKLKKSEDYIDEYSISTHLAVDYSKETLIEKLNLKDYF
ncbi:hypothetical protein P8625_11055 [Tenacibaculum tangerinum]|uniref:Uncharacterized protein n=1 Tax=Tenacibaculum tangerinum TaxID=3038772 RepID=A0ABY8L0K8_9FLAO|nr:hypothetical protein [Tenacibaculum tangerinum]WGH74626.1 hypothetical protein P8625_11055 [Tenacibaculum tangerinum]